jgi:hypothetical protein
MYSKSSYNISLKCKTSKRILYYHVFYKQQQHYAHYQHYTQVSHYKMHKTPNEDKQNRNTTQ